jgi:hypothetical protein
MKRLIGLALFLSCAGLPAAAQGDLKGWRLDGKAPHIVLDRVEETPDGHVLHLRNAYSATVMVIVTFLTEPGPDRVLHIGAVLYDDGFAEGDAMIVTQETYHRVGTMLEQERIRAILDATDEMRLGDDRLADLKKQMGNIPRAPEETFAAVAGVTLPGLPLIDPKKAVDAGPRAGIGQLSGVGVAREKIFRYIAQLEQLPETAVPGSPRPMLPPEAGRTRSSYFSYLRRQYDERSARYQEWGASHPFSIFQEAQQ